MSFPEGIWVIWLSQQAPYLLTHLTAHLKRWKRKKKKKKSLNIQTQQNYLYHVRKYALKNAPESHTKKKKKKLVSSRQFCHCSRGATRTLESRVVQQLARALVETGQHSNLSLLQFTNHSYLQWIVLATMVYPGTIECGVPASSYLESPPHPGPCGCCLSIITLWVA